MNADMVGNILSSLPDAVAAEVTDALVSKDRIRIERIVSRGQASPDGWWYDQEENEWVMVLQGSARLLFDGPYETVVMRTGDWISIPAHRRHRVEWTEPGTQTVWLAVFY